MIKTDLRLLPALLACTWLAACGMRSSMMAAEAGGADRGQMPGPDAGPDLPPETSRLPEVGSDLPADRGSPDIWLADLVGADLPTDRGSPDIGFADLGGPDNNADLPADLGPDTRPPLGPDVAPGTPDLAPGTPDLAPDTFGDGSEHLEAGCTRGSTLPCLCDNGLSGSRICLPSLVYSECGCGTDALMRVRNGVIGDWSGTATTPWVPPYSVTFTFDSYSHYSAKSSDLNVTALYYGVDDDSPLKRYSIDNIQASGDAVGTIDIYFGPNDTVREELQGIELSADLNHLKFHFMHMGQYGPLQYDLQRATP